MAVEKSNEAKRKLKSASYKDSTAKNQWNLQHISIDRGNKIVWLAAQGSMISLGNNEWEVQEN